MPVVTINPLGGGDFTSIQSWLNSLEYQTLTEPHIAELVGETVEKILFPPIETSEANYLEIRAAPGQRHTGALGTGARIKNPEGASGSPISVGWRHYRLTDLEIHSVTTHSAINSTGFAAGSTADISGCLIYSPLQTGTGYTLPLSSPSLARVSIKNTIVVSSARLLDCRTSPNVTVENCTFVGLADQILVLAKSGTTARNCYVGKATGSAACWYTESPFVQGSNNASSDTTAVTRFGAGSLNSIAPTDAFTDPANGDFTLLADSPLIDAGATIAGLTTDIIGTARPKGAAYDIGAFEYVGGSAPADPPLGTVTIGTITPGETTASVAYSYSDSDATGYEYRINSGTAASIGASPATITGLTASTTYDIEIRATNAIGSGAWSSVASFTTTTPAPGNTPPSFDGPNIGNLSGTVSAALASLDVSARFSDAESSLTFSAVGSWPAGVTVSSAGVISGTPTTAGTYSGLQVRATDAGALTADSNTFSITVAAAALPSTIAVTEPLKNNTGTLLANVSGVRVAVLEAATLAGVYETSGLTTNASGILAPITDASITTGQQYHVAIKLADGGVGITGPITAS